MYSTEHAHRTKPVSYISRKLALYLFQSCYQKCLQCNSPPPPEALKYVCIKGEESITPFPLNNPSNMAI